MNVVFLHAHGVGSVHTAYLVLLDPSCQTDDTNVILWIANGPDRNYPRCWQRMEIHARHVHISVQLLASLFHFIITSVSVLMVSAVQIQMCMKKYSLTLMTSLLEVAHVQHLWRQRRQHHALLALPRRHKVINVPIFCHP